MPKLGASYILLWPQTVLTDLTRPIYHVKFRYGWTAINLSRVTKQLAI
jgi:hypothetical protein